MTSNRALIHVQGDLQRFLGVLDQREFQALLGLIGNFRDVFLVSGRQDDGLDACLLGGQDFLLQSADRQDQTAQGDLARHGDVGPDRLLQEQADQRSEHGYAGTGTVFGDCSGGHVDVVVELGELLVIDPKVLGVGLDNRERRLGAFLHHVSDVAGQLQLPFAGHGR